MDVQPTTACLIAVCVLAAAGDLRSRRIPNWLTLPGLLLALGLHAVAGWSALAAGAAGAVLGALVGIPLFALGGMGGGDVKLLVVIGAFLGPARLPAALLVMSLAGGVMALWAVARRGVLRATLRNLGTFGKGLGLAVTLRDREVLSASLPAPETGSVTIPYAVPIALGALAGLAL